VTADKTVSAILKILITEAVRIYRKFKSKGKSVSELDVLLAGITTTNNETLITRDKDFLNFESERIRVV